LEIDWDSVKQILTLLVLFVAPAVLNFLRGKKGDEDEQDNPFGEIKLPASAKPPHRNSPRSEPRVARVTREEFSNLVGSDLKKPSSKVRVEKASSSSVPKYKQVGSKETSYSYEIPKKSADEKLGELSRSEVRRAWILKEVLDEPRALRPF
jgi:hypothetical protein